MKRTAPLMAALMILTSPIVSHADVPEWELVWADEFNGPFIDLSKWTHEVNGWGGGNNELQYYTARTENSRIENGRLVIEARRETYNGPLYGPDGGPNVTRDYTSGRLVTQGKGDWLYGRVEARAKLPSGQGLWPAFWMMPTDSEYGGWAASGEIDIMEYRGDQPDRLFSYLHFGGSWPENTSSGRSQSVGVNLDAGFNNYAIEWEPGVIRWYFNDELVHANSNWFSSAAGFPAPFNKRFFVILNVAVGGAFLPAPPANANYFPQRMEVEWVRVFQREAPTGQLPFPDPARPAAVPGRIDAANFDFGGQGVAYFDNTVENIGGGYRAGERADLGGSQDEPNEFSVGWFGTGEWMEYTVNVETAGIYRVDARTASDLGGGTLRVAVMQGSSEAQTVAGTFGGTGGWTNWQTVEIGELELPAGRQTLRFTCQQEGYNLNWVEFDLVTPVVKGEDQWSVF